MPTAEIPPRNPLPATPAAASPGSDLYDAESWECAYREMHGVPTLLIQLQDDLSRSRQREAFWISVVVHLAIVILAVNSNRLENLLHRHADLVRYRLRAQVLRIDLVFAQFVGNVQPVKNANGVRFRHCPF